MVVGLDGSAGSHRALAWAGHRIDQFGPILPVSAWHYPWWAVSAPAPGALLPPPATEFHEEAARVVDEMLDRVEPVDRLDAITVNGPAGPALVDVACGSDLLVVGTRGRGALAGGLLGSVSLHCVNHATVPVAIIPADAGVEDRAKRIVVGVDGSLNATTALAWVVDHAPEGTIIEVVQVWDLADTAVAEVASLAADRLEAMAWEMVTEMADKHVGRAGMGGFDLRPRVAQGDPRDVLRELSADADLLVLGARGHRGIAHLVLGSVTTALVHHPLVPTVVVH
jgi:nucleotide-binding universal stress UspA family protein